MLKLRKQLKKWLYGSCPGVAGSFPYFGTRVYFPKNSLIFNQTCEQGIYERGNLDLICSLLKPNTVYLDIGANVGIMSVPVLHNSPFSQVISMEPSPNALPFLIRTHKNSKFGDRWQIIGKAAGNKVGSESFSVAASEDLGALDGFEDTGRAGLTRRETVSVTTVDLEWEIMGKPPVSVIKIDVEGVELQTLEGATGCIKSEKPYILTEWTPLNFKSYNYEPEDLLKFAESIDYQVFSILPQPLSLRYFLHIDLVPVTSPTALKLQLLTTEDFLLAPHT